MKNSLKTPSAPIEAHASTQIAQIIGQALADTYVLYVKTQNFHWNIIDPRFYFLHEMLDDQYKALAKEIDQIAERIRMIRHRSPGSMRQFLELATLEESHNDLSGNDMIRQLAQDHDTLANQLRSRIEEVIKLGDEGTGDLFIALLRSHEKNAWMLRSHFIQDI